jgi:hypothetical protein
MYSESDSEQTKDVSLLIEMEYYKKLRMYSEPT